MSFDVESVSQEAAIIRIGSKLDFQNAGDFRSLCERQLESDTQYFILDFGDTGILDSRGLGALFSIYRQMKTLKGRMVIANPSRPVEVVIKLTRAYKVFGKYATVAEAKRAVLETEA